MIRAGSASAQSHRRHLPPGGGNPYPSELSEATTQVDELILPDLVVVTVWASDLWRLQ